MLRDVFLFFFFRYGADKHVGLFAQAKRGSVHNAVLVLLIQAVEHISWSPVKENKTKAVLMVRNFSGSYLKRKELAVQEMQTEATVHLAFHPFFLATLPCHLSAELITSSLQMRNDSVM